MIRVTVELLPGGREDRKRHLGTAIIVNDGSGDLSTGNYTVSLSKRGRPKDKWKTGSVRRFPRKRLGAWDLLYRALADTVGERNA